MSNINVEIGGNRNIKMEAERMTERRRGSKEGGLAPKMLDSQLGKHPSICPKWKSEPFPFVVSMINGMQRWCEV
jgi:hypothetical protein